MKQEYFKQLDALRAYAVFGVIFGHIPLLSLSHDSWLKMIYSYLPGVPVFFSISGFLITLIILKHQNETVGSFLKSFYIRRFLRIFPIYYGMIAALFIVGIPGYRSWAIYDVFYISNIKIGLLGSFDGLPSPHFWSLAVEEQFYLFWPFLLMVFPRKKSFYIIGLFVAIGLAFTILSGRSFLMARTLTPLCFLGGGGMLAYFYFHNKETLMRAFKWRYVVLLLFIGLIVMQQFGLLSVSPVFHVIISLVVALTVVLQFIIGFKGKLIKLLLENKVVVYLGKISYGLYVYHLFMHYPVGAIKKIFAVEILNNELVMHIVQILLTILVATLSWEFFEKRINRLKKRFPYRAK